MSDPTEAPDLDRLAELETQLVIRAGHGPTCGEGAEFPWDCTCDYAGFMDRMGRVFAAARGARDLIANYLWNEDDSGDEDDLQEAYEELRAILGPTTEEGLGQTLAARLHPSEPQETSGS